MAEINSDNSSNYQNKYCVVLCTCPNQVSAETIANVLVTEKLAACVNIIPGITSVYTWQGSLEKSQELLLVIKSKVGAFSNVENAILAHHPYELPEIISIPIENGLSGYLSWIDENTDKGALPTS